MSSPARPLTTVRPSMPVRNALRLYVSGACKTKKDASTAAGLHPNYLTMLTGPNGSEPVKRVMSEMEEALMDRTLDMSHLIEFLGRKALLKIGELSESQNERIALDAAKDLLDRSPETQKVQRLQVDSFTISSHDAQEIARALVESAEGAKEYASAIDGLVEIEIDTPKVKEP